MYVGETNSTEILFFLNIQSVKRLLLLKRNADLFVPELNNPCGWAHISSELCDDALLGEENM